MVSVKHGVSDKYLIRAECLLPLDRAESTCVRPSHEEYSVHSQPHLTEQAHGSRSPPRRLWKVEGGEVAGPEADSEMGASSSSAGKFLAPGHPTSEAQQSKGSPREKLKERRPREPPDSVEWGGQPSSSQGDP